MRKICVVYESSLRDHAEALVNTPELCGGDETDIIIRDWKAPDDYCGADTVVILYPEENLGSVWIERERQRAVASGACVVCVSADELPLKIDGKDERAVRFAESVGLSSNSRDDGDNDDNIFFDASRIRSVRRAVEGASRQVDGGNGFLCGRYSYGGTVEFGSYPQSSGGDYLPIKWCVLAVEKDRILLVSRYVLDCLPFEQDIDVIEEDGLTWNNSLFRTWLNDDFYDAAFSEEEKEQIELSRISDDMGIGEDVYDKVFLLSRKEAEKYFPGSAERACAPTAYAKSEGTVCGENKNAENKNTCWWWLRSVNEYSEVFIIDDTGEFCDPDDPDQPEVGVRPAIWVKN